MLPRLLVVNVAVWLLVRIVALVLTMAHAGGGFTVVDWLALPAQPSVLLVRPWTLLTHMVSHYSLWHLLMNVLWLYWMGQLFLDYFTPKQLGGLYLLGGLGGALLFLLGSNLLPGMPGNPVLLGASAAVLAVVIGVASYAPQRRIGLLLLGEVPIGWLAAASLVLIVLGGWETNLGGQLAHVGGALVGLAYGLLIKAGRDITRPINTCLDAVATAFKPRKRGPRLPKRPKTRPQRGTSQQASSSDPHRPTEAEIDEILDKLRRSGYDALSQKEKATLFAASGKPNNNKKQ